MSKIDELLMRNLAIVDHTTQKDIDTTKQQLLQEVLERVIGEDEIENAVTGMGSEFENEYAVGRNQLRKEQRQRVEELLK